MPASSALAPAGSGTALVTPGLKAKLPPVAVVENVGSIEAAYCVPIESAWIHTSSSTR